MAKYYIGSGNLRAIVDTNKTALEAAMIAVMQCEDEIESVIYVDERGVRNKNTKDALTAVFETDFVLDSLDD